MAHNYVLVDDLPVINHDDLAFFQQGRPYGESDFEFDCGRISHGLLSRYNNLVVREELTHEIILGVLVELCSVIIEEHVSKIGKYVIGRIPHYRMLFAKIESAVVVVRDSNRDVSSRASLFFLKAYNAALYYEPILEVIRYGHELGFGNSHFEYLYQYLDNDQDAPHVLMPGAPNWCEFDSEHVQDVLRAHGLCERIKLESLYSRYSRMVNLTRLFSSNENQQERFFLMRPLFTRCADLPALLKHLWPAMSVRIHTLIPIVENRLYDEELSLTSHEEVLDYLRDEIVYGRLKLRITDDLIKQGRRKVRRLERKLCEELMLLPQFRHLDYESNGNSDQDFIRSYTYPSFTDPLIRDIPRLNLRFRQYRMSGRWIDHFPHEHEIISEDLLTYNHSDEASDYIQYWERLFYEPLTELPEVVELMSDLEINP